MNWKALAMGVGLALLAAASVFGSGTTGINGTTRQCTDPCFQAARGAFRDCASSASGAFADALDGCLERHHECVDACRSQRQDFRDQTSAGLDLAACQMQLVAEKARCRNQFRRGSIRLAACLDRAEAGAFACRRRVRREFRQALFACQSAFGQCADACGAGEPPLGVQMCTAGAKSAFKAVIADCRQTSQASASACIGKDVMCVPDCTDARETCNAPTQAALNAAIAACTMQETTAVATCAATYPAGSPELQQCIQTAQASAFTCRDAALQAAAPGFQACGQQYLACLKACPPA